ncbi:hypothetical protein RJ639_001454 [Escallonia herrerae]|uniref:Serine incorporator n=1 Tax=Escallonia herrerae TaxID=1293975 RepID=A0AA88XBT1_9ASTE|nr:hypothetical protein RJ639_001454 [Escallonia herrerae]
MEGATNSVNGRYANLMEGSWCSQFCHGSNPWMARYVYGLMFLITNLLAWAIRDYGRSALTEMERLKGCEGGKDCLGAEGVLRVSLGCFTFYFTMFLSTTGTSKLHEPRELWHSGWWSAKILLLIGMMAVPFFVPSTVIQLYGSVAHFGAGVFLLIQLISIISFINWLNHCCQSDRHAERWEVLVVQPNPCDVTCNYRICRVHTGDHFDVHLVHPTAVLRSQHFLHHLDTSTLTIHDQRISPPKSKFQSSPSLLSSFMLFDEFICTQFCLKQVNAGFLTPGFMGLYLAFLCWSAIRSEPPEEKCIRKAHGATKGDWLTIISFVVAVIALVIATFSTGIDSKCFQFKKDERQDEDDVPYGYGFFHFVFATGGMYFAMLLIGWNSHHTMKRWTIDVGWTSTWVRIVNEWLAVCIYVWMLVAPIIFKARQTGEST